MLVYHPAFDLYHGLFRALLLLESSPERAMPSDTLRIIDLYFVFPYLLAELEFPRGAGGKGRKLAGKPSRFNTLPAPRVFLAQTEGLHKLIGSALAGKDLIEGETLQKGRLARTDKAIPEGLLNAATSDDIELASYLGSTIATIPLLGKNGLKARSKLMEFRYDPT
jgi:hypothetical protein